MRTQAGCPGPSPLGGRDRAEDPRRRGRSRTCWPGCASPACSRPQAYRSSRRARERARASHPDGCRCPRPDEGRRTAGAVGQPPAACARRVSASPSASTGRVLDEGRRRDVQRSRRSRPVTFLRGRLDSGAGRPACSPQSITLLGQGALRATPSRRIGTVPGDQQACSGL